MAPPQLCIICGVQPVKYRFPCCRQRYCSSACYRTHAASGCIARRPLTDGGVKRPREEEQAGDEEDVLSEVRLCALRGHQGVRQALRSDQFCELLQSLDSARDRRRALEDLLEKDSYFAEFVDHMMEAIDYAPPQR
mmetsp:Transcript_109173/g.305489  ORF Transcript_109173/g.305489 Transcript_109173/m.305489 type:complete len:136 (+) Transcript_109173:88-495(+)